MLLQIDPHQLADCLNQWLQANPGTLPRALAIDGKWIRDRALSLCLSDHETGAPAAVGFAREKTPNDDAQSKDDHKREGEQTVALRLYTTSHGLNYQSAACTIPQSLFRPSSSAAPNKGAVTDALRADIEH